MKVDDVPLWKKKKVGMWMKCRELSSWSAEDASHLFICVCNGSKRSVKFKSNTGCKLRRLWEGTGVILDVGICQWPSERRMERGNMGLGESWEGNWRT